MTGAAAMMPRRSWAWPAHLVFLLTTLACVIPQAFVLWRALDGRPSILGEAPAVVWGMLCNTLVVAAVAVALAVAIGFASAFLIVRCALPGRRPLSVLLCLPFAVPPFAYATALLGWDGFRHLPLPEGPVGVGVILGLALYPWVYVPAKATLARQGRHYQELAACLGMGPWRRWWSVELWLVLPTVAGSALLVFMAVLNDFGTAALMGVQTLSVGVHDAMFSMERPDWAAQLSALGLLLPGLAVALFAVANGRRAAYQPANRGAPAPIVRLATWQRLLASGFLMAVLGAGLLLPLGLLVLRAWPALTHMSLAPLVGPAWHTLQVTLAVGAITVGLAMWLNLVLRRRSGLAGWGRIGLLFNLTYALPSSMLAIALLFIASSLPVAVTDLILSRTWALLLFAGVLTYLCFPFAAIAAGLAALPRSLDDLCTVARLDGRQRLVCIQLPLLRGHIAAGALLVVVAMAQELPLTLILQPFDFQTLGLRMYDLARVDALRPAAVYALAIIALLAYPVAVLDRLIAGDADART